MTVKCEVKSCKYNTFCLQIFVCNKEDITIGHGNKNGEWVFAECTDYVKTEVMHNDGLKLHVEDGRCKQ